MKSRSKLFVVRDIIRAIFALGFILFAVVFGILEIEAIEFESEYVVLIAIAVLGTFWCGWFCAFGNVQYFVGKLGKKYLKRFQINIPKHIDSKLRYLKYAFLLLFIYVFATTEFSYFDDHFEMYQSRWDTFAFLVFKLSVAVPIIPLFIPQFFCKYFCPQKALYQVINFCLPFLKIDRNTGTCNDCKKCNRVCPMGIDIAGSKKVSGGECIGCFSCVDNSGCTTKPSSLGLKWFGVKVNPLPWSLFMSVLYMGLTIFFIYWIG